MKIEKIFFIFLNLIICYFFFILPIEKNLFFLKNIVIFNLLFYIFILIKYKDNFEKDLLFYIFIFTSLFYLIFSPFLTFLFLIVFYIFYEAEIQGE